MSLRLSGSIFVACSLFALQLLGAERVFEVNGVIRGKLLDGRPVIEQEEIPGYMMAMTMVFNVSDHSEIVNLEAGDRVRFKFHVSEDSSFADQFIVLARGADSSVVERVSNGFQQSLGPGDLFPEFQLKNESAAAITEDILSDKFTVVTFMFTRCPVPEFCPLLATRFSAIQNQAQSDPQFGLRIRLLSITLDPDFDTPAVLSSYAKLVGADPNRWSFATGEMDQITSLTRAFQMGVKRGNASLDHTLITALVGPDGRLIHVWPGNRWQPEQVLEEVKNAEIAGSCCVGAECEE
ncbi:MAG: SCO family protein [Verrucomicrobia bacterium]|nr:SCO family protein [Verrucomicrobiota bacterium]MDA1065435.1 SCO family protein [Verrucomicrobiota bacterium]